MPQDLFLNGLPTVPSIWVEDMTLRLKRKNHDAFMKEREVLLDAYEGNNLQELTDAWFTNKAGVVQSSVPGASQNLMDRAIRRASLVYKNAPQYTDDNGDAIDWPDGYSSLKRWQFFKDAEKTANNIGTVLLRPVYRNDRMEYDLLWNYVPFFDDESREPTGILYRVETNSANITDKVEIEWVFWTKDIVIRMDDNGNSLSIPNNEDNVNPYGILPFVTVNVRDGQDYWRWGYGKPLLDANTAINVGLTEMRLGQRYAMMGQGVATGVDDDTPIERGVDKTIKLPDGATFTFESPSADMNDAVTYLRSEYENTMQNMGLHVTWGEDGGVPSGESLRVKNLELLERREDDVPTWQIADDDVYEVEQAIWAVDGAGELPARSVNFTEIEFPVTPAEQQARDDWGLLHGQLTEAEILIRENPDGYADLDEAQAQVNENKQTGRPRSFAEAQ